MEEKKEEEKKAFKLSVSKCKTYKDCKKKYNYSYNIKLPKKEQIYHTFGKFAHKILEDFHNAYINGSTEKQSVEMNKAWKSAVTEYSDKLTPELKKECWDIFNAYLKKSSKENMKSFLACEKSFNVNITDELILNGFIDMLKIDDDGVYHVIDYKTSKSKSFLKKDFFQLITYAFVLLEENPNIEKVRGSYMMLRHKFELISFEFTKKEILEVKQMYIDYYENIIQEKEYPATITKLCDYCDFNEVCDDFLSQKDDLVCGEKNW